MKFHIDLDFSIVNPCDYAVFSALSFETQNRPSWVAGQARGGSFVNAFGAPPVRAGGHSGGKTAARDRRRVEVEVVANPTAEGQMAEFRIQLAAPGYGIVAVYLFRAAKSPAPHPETDPMLLR